MIPDSVDPWVYVPLPQQLDRGLVARKVLASIPVDSSVATETHLIP